MNIEQEFEKLDLELKVGLRSNSANITIFNIFEKLNLPKDSHFVDVGCGKGGILFLAHAYGFKQITGIENVKETVEICRKNLAGKDIKIIEGDIREVEIDDSMNIFYLFNPFGKEIMKVFLDKIKHLPKVHLIYKYAICHDLIEKAGFELKKAFGLEKLDGSSKFLTELSPHLSVYYYKKNLDKYGFYDDDSGGSIL